MALFMAKGFSHVNTDEIAAHIGISKRTLYRYFPSKEDLISATSEHFKMKIRGQIETILASQKPPLQLFAEFLEFIARSVAGVSPALLEDFERLRPDIFAEIVAFRTNNIRQMSALLIKAQERGEIAADVDTVFATELFLSAINSMLTPQYLMAHNYSYQQTFEGIRDTFLKGILSRKNTETNRTKRSKK